MRRKKEGEWVTKGVVEKKQKKKKKRLLLENRKTREERQSPPLLLHLFEPSPPSFSFLLPSLKPPYSPTFVSHHSQ